MPISHSRAMLALTECAYLQARRQMSYRTELYRTSSRSYAGVWWNYGHDYA